MKDLYRSIQEEISIENLYKNMEVLVNQIGERLSGSDELRRAALYINEQLINYGIETKVDTFPMYQSFPGNAEIKVLSPVEINVKAEPVCHILSTPLSGIEGELIYLGSGSYEDYDNIDAKNKIILTDMNWTPGRPEKARIAYEMGAKGLIIMNWGKPEDNLIQMGAVKSQWGNPTPETFNDIPQITVVSISRLDGEKLIDLCKGGMVKVWIKANASREWVTAYQPTAFVKGGKSNGQYVLVGSHIDAWGKSAICNSSGNALNIELARIFNKYKAYLKRDIVFVFWDGHEIAECAGSTWYCDKYWKELSNCVAYINIDNLAIKGTTEPGIESLPELKNFLMDSIKFIWEVDGKWHHAYKGGGDSSFFGVGVPYISFATEYTDDMLKELNYAFYSPWLHSDNDTIDKIDKDLYIKHINYFSHILFELLDRDLIPYNLTDMAINIKCQVDSLINEFNKYINYLSVLQKEVDKYLILARKIEDLKDNDIFIKRKENLDIINNIMLYWEKETTVFRNESGRYGQDACCYLQTEKPIPALHKTLKNMDMHTNNSQDFYLWETKVMREVNRAFDSLEKSNYFAELLLSCNQLKL